jgi:hypothetical protein
MSGLVPEFGQLERFCHHFHVRAEVAIPDCGAVCVVAGDENFEVGAALYNLKKIDRNAEAKKAGAASDRRYKTGSSAGIMSRSRKNRLPYRMNNHGLERS